MAGQSLACKLQPCGTPEETQPPPSPAPPRSSSLVSPSPLPFLVCFHSSKHFCISSRKGGIDSAEPSLFAGRIIGKKLLAECKCQAAAFNKRDARSELHFRAAKAPSPALPSLPLLPLRQQHRLTSFPGAAASGSSFLSPLLKIPPEFRPGGEKKGDEEDAPTTCLPLGQTNPFCPLGLFSPGQVAACNPEERTAGRQISGSFQYTPLPSVRNRGRKLSESDRDCKSVLCHQLDPNMGLFGGWVEIPGVLIIY